MCQRRRGCNLADVNTLIINYLYFHSLFLLNHLVKYFIFIKKKNPRKPAQSVSSAFQLYRTFTLLKKFNYLNIHYE
ncbi:MAG: hypothetical protein RL329_106 [Bacteroidota bacterium]